MIARISIRVPFSIHVPTDLIDTQPVQELEVAGMGVRFFPPFRTSLTPGDLDPESATPVMDLSRRLIPAPDQTSDSTVLMNGQPTVRCDGLRLEFRRDEFDRSSGSIDPSIELAFSLFNDWLARLRLLSQASQIHPVEALGTLWRVEFLQDDGSEVEPAEGLIRARMSTTFSFQSVGLTDGLWNAVGSLPWGFEASPAETLLLDAAAAVRDIGPAIVLAATALETRISQALDVLAATYGVQPGIWRWANEREFFLKNPSTEEQFDSLLQAIARRSLKEEPRLWQGFKNLRTARNRFAHGGSATIGTEVVDWQRAASLIGIAREIVDWVEGLLPEANRRPRYEGQDTFESTRILVAPEETLPVPTSAQTPDPAVPAERTEPPAGGTS